MTRRTYAALSAALALAAGAAPSYLTAQQSGGLTPQQALLTATVNPGRFLGRRDLAGRVAIRQRADLVLLDANPLEDIGATQRIHAVIANGRSYDRPALDAMLAALKLRAGP